MKKILAMGFHCVLDIESSLVGRLHLPADKDNVEWDLQSLFCSVNNAIRKHFQPSNSCCLHVPRPTLILKLRAIYRRTTLQTFSLCPCCASLTSDTEAGSLFAQSTHAHWPGGQGHAPSAPPHLQTVLFVPATFSGSLCIFPAFKSASLLASA